MKKRQKINYIKGLLLITLAIPFLAISVGNVSTVLALDKATFNMSWLPQGSTVGVVVGIKKGFYKEVGIDAKAIRGYGGNRTANELDQEMFEFAFGNPVGMIFANSKGGNVKMVAALYDEWPGALCYIKEAREPRSIEDLKGMTIGGGSYSPVHNVVPAWLKKNGFPIDHVKLLRMNPEVITVSLIEGKIDLAECWAGSNRPLIKQVAKRNDKTAGWLDYKKFNLNIYGSGLATTTKLIANNPDLVRRFTKATLRGYKYARENPEESADLYMKGYPTLERGILLEQITDMSEFTRPKDSTHPLGWMREDRWKETVSFISNAYNLKKQVKTSDMYTNEFLK